MRQSVCFLSGILALCVLGCDLGTSNLGAPPDKQLTASARYGSVPLSTVLSVTFPNASAYTIKTIAWDFDGDGADDTSSVLLDKGAITEGLSYTMGAVYATAAQYSPQVHVVYNENSAQGWATLNSVSVQDTSGATITTNKIIAIR